LATSHLLDESDGMKIEFGMKAKLKPFKAYVRIKINGGLIMKKIGNAITGLWNGTPAGLCGIRSREVFCKFVIKER